jgi:catechol 2,3-dioxygenase-like lactoylglutathione lyase family enzyme
MIFGAHVIVYSKDATADRAFLRDILGFGAVDAGQAWLIFALPPVEVAVHPAEDDDRHELYFMCDDLRAEILTLGEKGVRCSEVQEARWGSVTKIRLPGGAKLVFTSQSIHRHWPALQTDERNDVAFLVSDLSLSLKSNVGKLRNCHKPEALRRTE